MTTYRCPVDETVFDTNKSNRVPTLEGHPDCHGPACTAKFGGGKPAEKPAEQTGDGKTSLAQVPAPVGQGW